VALIDVRHRNWAVAAAVLGAGATAAYVAYSAHEVDGPRGSTAVGLAFGIAAAAIMLFDAALNLRKRLPTWALGRAETWLKGHIWLGLLTIPLVFFHGGFRLGGTLTTVLMIVFFAMIVSGLYGLALQQWLPRFMTTQVRHETVYEQIPHVVERLRIEAYDIAAGVCGEDVLPPDGWERVQSGTIQADYRKTRRRGALRRPAPEKTEGSEPVRSLYLELQRFLVSDGRTGMLATPEGAARMVDGIARGLPPPLQETARELGEIAAERRDLATQRRLHMWLHTWLLVHVPLTVALFVLLGAHIWWALRYSL
jgi:hypothetical protein